MAAAEEVRNVQERASALREGSGADEVVPPDAATFLMKLEEFFLVDFPKLHPAVHMPLGFFLGFVMGWVVGGIGKWTAFLLGVFMAVVVVLRQTGHLDMDVRSLRQQVVATAERVRQETRRGSGQDVTHVVCKFCRKNVLFSCCWLCGLCFGIAFGA